MSDPNLGNDKDLRYLAFNLGSGYFAVPLLKVREVIALTEITPVPGMPSHLGGILNLRGEVISVVDLRSRFRITPKPDQSDAAIMIVDVHSLKLGVMVDSVESVLALHVDQISAVTNPETSNQPDFVSAVARCDSQLIALINLEKSLGIEHLIASQPTEHTHNAA